MNASYTFTAPLMRLVNAYLSMNMGSEGLNSTQFKLRLLTATATKIDPEVGLAWRNRMLMRDRLRRYANAGQSMSNHTL